MFYAKFAGIDNEVMEFQTKQERDDFVNFQDELSLALGTTKDNAPFQREALTIGQAIILICFFGLCNKEEYIGLDNVIVHLA